MIIYATRQTAEYYELKAPSELSDPIIRRLAETVYDQERGNRLLEWGAKQMYFDGRPCVQVCNFASRFTLVLVNFTVDDIDYMGDSMAEYMMDIYSADKKTTALLERFFKDYPVVCFGKLTDRRIITSLNGMQSNYLRDGDGLYRYIRDGIFHSKELNKDVSKYPVTEKVDGKPRYYLPVEKFAELLHEHYA